MISSRSLGSSALALLGLSHHGAKPFGQLEQPVEPRLRIAPRAADHQLHVGAQLGRALQPLDIGDAGPPDRGTCRCGSVTSVPRAPTSILAMFAAIAWCLISISLTRLAVGCGQRAEAVDHLGGEALDLGLVARRR